jgi:streptogramin lyase
MNFSGPNWSHRRAPFLIATAALALSVAACAGAGGCVCGPIVAPKKAALHEFPIPLASGAQPIALASGSDHNIWFTACQVILGGNMNKMNGWIGRLALPANSITLYPLQPGGTQRCPVEITAGPDGNLWFNETTFAGKGIIGRVMTSGVITEFALPTMQRLNGIATGADGNIWISGTPVAGNFAIAAVSPSTGMIVKSASIPNAQGNPEDLVSNPVDNSIVAAGYNEAGASDIYSVNTSGVPTATIVATQGADVAAFWVMLAYGANTIFVPNTIAPSGGNWSTLTLSASGYTQNIVPGIPGNNMAQGIAFGPDGNVYLADDQTPNTGLIYVMSASGSVIRSYALSTPGVYPFQSVAGFGNPMGVGPDGNIYFAESNNRKIGEIALH